MEYLKYGDFKSLAASIRYVSTHKLPGKDYETSSGMGKFHIRRNTTDFQFINYAYEKSIKDYMLKNINTFDVFIDAGACMGEYDIWLAKMGKRCIAIEPVNFATMTKNISLNGLEDKIQTFNCGVGDKYERVYFEILENVTSSSHIERSSSKEPNVTIEKIDDLSKRFNISDTDRILMKIDVETMEEEVINGSAEFIKSRKDFRIIYEDFPEDNLRNDKLLQKISNFKFERIDDYNRIATKI
jgi:FkbM family methyltransferase